MDTTDDDRPQITAVYLTVTQDHGPQCVVEYDREGPVTANVTAAVTVDPDWIAELIRAAYTEDLKADVLAHASLAVDTIGAVVDRIADVVAQAVAADQ